MSNGFHHGAIPALCAACEARHGGICGALTAEQLTALARTSIKHKFAAGKELVGEDEGIERYSNILSGVVKLTKMLSDGRQQIVELQFAPDFIGRPFKAASSVSAEAATDVELCSFPRDAVERMMEEQPDVGHRLLQQALKELDQARDWMMMLGRKTAAEKIASFLLLISRNVDPTEKQGVGEFDLPLSRAEIADFLGLTIETVSRQLTRLRSEGVVAIAQNRHVTITAPQRLVDRAGA